MVWGNQNRNRPDAQNGPTQDANTDAQGGVSACVASTTSGTNRSIGPCTLSRIKASLPMKPSFFNDTNRSSEAIAGVYSWVRSTFQAR